jgi:hypothetical protein
VSKSLKTDRFDAELPIVQTIDPDDVCVIRELKLHCLCRGLYAHGHIVTCRLCENHYHPRCMLLEYDVCPTFVWQSLCCAGVQLTGEFVPDPQDEVVAAEGEICTTSSPFNERSIGRRPIILLQFSQIRYSSL